MPNHPPLYIHALSDNEIEILRQVVIECVTGEEKLFRQSMFMGDGGDIRNFMKTPNARPNPQFLSSIYNYIMTTVYSHISMPNINKISPKRKHILSLIEELISLGLRSERYDRDITLYMNKFISGNMAEQNVSLRERGFYVGYRYLTNKSKVLRFFVHIYHDPHINRTRFRSIALLPGQLRDTKGFSYSSGGNTFLSGFINSGIGCEFIAVKNAAHVALRVGIATTTSSNGSPTAKRCILVQAGNTIFRDFAKENKDEYLSEDEWSKIGDKMVIADAEDWKFDIHNDVTARVDLDQFVDPETMIQI